MTSSRFFAVLCSGLIATVACGAAAAVYQPIYTETFRRLPTVDAVYQPIALSSSAFVHRGQVEGVLAGFDEPGCNGDVADCGCDGGCDACGCEDECGGCDPGCW